MKLLADQFKHRAFPEVAAALRERAAPIADVWMALVREVMPQMERLDLEGLRNSIPLVLEAVAAALASAEHEGLEEVVRQAAEHGFSRCASEHDTVDLFQEERLMRGVIIVQVSEALGRAPDPAESAALHATIDLVMQSSVLAMIERKREQLRERLESEVKYLSFFSHDLNNNLSIVDAALARLARRLQRAAAGGGMDKADGLHAMTSLMVAREAIAATTAGMRRLLEHERLRKEGRRPAPKRVNLREAAERIAKRFTDEAQRKGIHMRIDCPGRGGDASLETDEELLGLVLQNLVGNAVKFTDRPGAAVQISIAPARDGQPAAEAGAPEPPAGRPGWKIAVADEGPGIDAVQRARLFQAFKRGEGLGHEGVGLGLAIVAQAARLMEAEVRVDSSPGNGSVFTVALPERAAAPGPVVVRRGEPNGK